MKYRITAKGRESGAIGIFHRFSEIVEAESQAEANLKLYQGKTQSGKAWEHITSLQIEEMPQD